MTKEEIAKEIDKSLERFLGETVTKTTVDSAKEVLTSQIRRIADKYDLNIPTPIPQIEVVGTMANIHFIHPGTGEILTQYDLDMWLHRRVL